MSRFSEDEVRRLAGLAQLSLSDDECRTFAEQLERVLGYAERIQTVDTGDLPATSHALLSSGAREPRRDDEPEPGLGREEVLRQAPDTGDGLFKVPKVIP